MKCPVDAHRHSEVSPGSLAAAVLFDALVVILGRCLSGFQARTEPRRHDVMGIGIEPAVEVLSGSGIHVEALGLGLTESAQLGARQGVLQPPPEDAL